MKHVLSLTAVLTLVANVALATPASGVHARDMNCPPDLGHAVSFFRADKVNTDHFYSTNYNQIDDFVKHSGYKANVSIGRIFTTQEPGTIPLFRFYNMAKTDHIYTTDIAEKNKLPDLGYNGEGIAGYVLQSDSCKFLGYSVLPLHRLYSKTATAHLITHDAHEKPAGYVVDRTVGYVIVGFPGHV